jgi:hypothetical protein
MATLTVTIKEEVVLNGNEHGSENIIDIGNVDSMFERLIDCTVTEVPLLSFGSTVTGDTFVDDTVKYLRITNLDDTNYVTLRVLGASKEYFVVLEPKNSYVLFNDAPTPLDLKLHLSLSLMKSKRQQTPLHVNYQYSQQHEDKKTQIQ